MKRLMFFLLFIICSGTYAKLSLELEYSQIQLGQTFRLILSQDDAQAGGVPDLTVLQNEFNIVGTERSTSYTVVNGQAASTNQWIITLMPKKAGTLVIPPIKMGQEQTKAASIIVSTNSSSSTPSTLDDVQDVMLVAEVSNEQPHVNEQVLYTVKLYNSRRLVDASYEPPFIEDGLLVPVGNGRHYQATENGRLYGVEEQQYAIFPQKSGEFKINPPTMNALVYDVVPQRISVKATQLTLHVKPIPEKFKSSDWLPAKLVTLSENYDKNLGKLAQGSTVTRTITLRAVGYPSQLLPKLVFTSTDLFSVYPEKSSEKNFFKQNEIEGNSTIKLTYLFNHAGKIVVPAVKIAWFNTKTGKKELATLPEQAIEVVATEPRPSESGTQPVAGLEPLPQKTAHKAINYNTPAWWLAGGFAGAWFITLFLGWKKRRNFSKSNKKKFMASLKEACLTNQPDKARTALLEWGRWQWPEQTILSLSDLEQLNRDPELKKQIAKLLKISYSSGKHVWEGEELWRCVTAYKELRTKNKAQVEALPPINP